MRASFIVAAILGVGACAFGAWRTHARKPVVTPLPENELTERPPRLILPPAIPSLPPPPRVPLPGHLLVQLLDEAGRTYPAYAETPMAILITGDRRRRLEDPGDAFWDLTLAPGEYLVDVYTDSLVGTSGPVTVHPGNTTAIHVQLGPGVPLSGRIECTPDDGEEFPSWQVELELTNEGDSPAFFRSSGDGPDFQFDGFLPGRKYDLVFSSEGRRPVKLSGITAPAQGLVARFASLPTLRGGIGVAKGDPCPAREVTVIDEEEGSTYLGYLDVWCRFQFTGLPESNRLRVEIPSHPSFKQNIAIPKVGDPPFVCLSGRCDEGRPEDKATLEVILDEPEVNFYALLHYTTKNRPASRYARGTGQAQFADLESGVGVEVYIPRGGCEPQRQTLQLAPGLNRAYVQCPRGEGE